jgi:hypothetical protein
MLPWSARLARLQQLLFPVYRFDRESKWQPGTTTVKKQRQQSESALRCAFCNYIITSKDKAISVDGKHVHLCTNPMGVTFEIALYQQAECVEHGIATTEHTWFSDCAWQLALCSNCKSHLGWRFTCADSDSFYGLIRTHLVEL